MLEGILVLIPWSSKWFLEFWVSFQNEIYLGLSSIVMTSRSVGIFSFSFSRLNFIFVVVIMPFNLQWLPIEINSFPVRKKSMGTAMHPKE